MVIVYPLQTQADYTELLFSLRSIEKFFIPPYEVVIVGERLPDWITNVTQIIIPDLPGRKQFNIKRKIYSALEYSNPIFFMNDDVFLLEVTDGYSYPYYYQGNLQNQGEAGARPLLTNLLRLKKDIKNFDIHQPLVYDYQFKDVFVNFPSDVIVKSCYCNYLNIPGEAHVDLKINKAVAPLDVERMIQGRKYFSTGPSGIGSCVTFLRNLFPDKSKFEI